MLKRQFQTALKPFLKKNDKPHNRQVWNDMLYHFDSQLPSNAHYWKKTPKKLYN